MTDEGLAPQSGVQAAFDIIAVLNEVGEASELVTEDILSEECDPDTMKLYIKKLRHLWSKLFTYLSNRKSFGEPFEKRFMEFKTFYYNPIELLPLATDTDDAKEGKVKRAFEMEYMLRETVDKLKITNLEG